MPSSHQLLLIRHCQALGQAPEAALTAEGQVQAQTLAHFLADQPIDHIVSSPFVRARQSIAPLAAVTGLPVQLDKRLSERRLAPEPIAHWRQMIRDSFLDPDLRMPGGESGREAQTRGWAALDVLQQGGYTLPAAATHGHLISLILHALDPAFGYEQWAALSNPDVFLLKEHQPGHWQYERIWT